MQTALTPNPNPFVTGAVVVKAAERQHWSPLMGILGQIKPFEQTLFHGKVKGNRENE
jgi:hypothetical protein